MTLVVVGEISLEVILLEGALTIDDVAAADMKAAQFDENTCSPWAASAADTTDGAINAIKAARAKERK